MRQFTNITRGFTLLEMMVASSVLLVLGFLVVSWLTSVSELWWTSTTQAQARTNVLQAISRMTSELTSATRTGSPTPPGVSIPSAPANTQITFYLPMVLNPGDPTTRIIDTNGNLQWDTANPIQYVYDSATKQLRRIQGSQTVILAIGVTSALFDDVSTDSSLLSNEVKIRLSLQIKTPQGRLLSASAAEVVKLRN